ncbi:MAG: D-alanyl-D-alanine carboxypeptidase family protein [Armatimonadota bacterium]|nr:D-alanyl-D-alanine carboxypeptidase family protein [Armatimonadota bacterium]MDR7445216.1 D-alanyl-D-alanine carboxypeptidase family protein [Armatimonadota bacterium]MDR7615523.1 D-alanyl-D-alanine carboxypeptidase family protein [Armatimonadota bacterium]
MRARAVGLLLTVGLLASPARGSAPPQVEATAFVLLEERTGQVLLARNPDLPRPPASTTKILTALLVLENLPLDRVVRISARAAAQREGSSVGLEVGERRTVRELLYALLVKSANDAAVALAEAVDGSVEGFVRRMNARAWALGARNTHFVNPHGLHQPGHYTTASDLARLARAALRNPVFREIVRTREYEYPGLQGPLRLLNGNRLLGHYPGADGVKTGWTAESGRCLVASATRNGRRLLVVLLNAPQVFRDAARLLDYGFEEFELRVFAQRGAVVGSFQIAGGLTVPVVAARDLVVSLPRGTRAVLRVWSHPDLHPPIGAGEVVGGAEVVVAGRAVARAPLVAGEPVRAPSRLGDLWRRLFRR